MPKLVKKVCPLCQEEKVFRDDCKTCGCQGTNPRLTNTPKAEKPKIVIDNTEIELQKLRDKRDNKDAENAKLRERVILLEKEIEVYTDLQDRAPEIIDILPRVKSSESESSAVVVLSDVHAEERVLPEQVSNQNEYNIHTVVPRRWDALKRGSLAWYKIASRDTTIKTIILALLGDFITGSIHEDLAEGNQLAPADAAHFAFSLLVDYIKYMLENTPQDVTFILPCHSGNHGRMTKEQRIATEAGNSLEYFMYLMLQDYFQDEKRLQFIIQRGYHSYVRFFEGAFETRFHHGHQINYQGGVGGITIPVNKAIAQWNKAHAVDLDVFGHFHTKFDGGNFIANGSMIGYSAYGVSIKASYEPPCQQFFLVNRQYAAKTLVAPIYLETAR